MKVKDEIKKYKYWLIVYQEYKITENNQSIFAEWFLIKVMNAKVDSNVKVLDFEEVMKNGFDGSFK